MDTCKLIVQVAKSVGDDSIPRPWSKHSKTVAETPNTPLYVGHESNKLDESTKSQLTEIEKDPKLKEFVKVMTKSGKVWENDELAEEFTAETDEKVNSIAFNETISDLDYLKSKMSGALKETTTEVAEADEKDSSILDTGRLFVRNLSYTCTEEELRAYFQRFGPISEIHLPIDKETKKGKGFAYVLFMIPENAVSAFTECDGKIFQGRLLHILSAKGKIVQEEPAETNFKKLQEKKKKESAISSFNWNSLFMNQDAVMESVAKELKISKSELLDPESDNLAVRMALAETKVISDTKSFLEENGITINSIKSKERSDTIILVKNIPHSTTVEDLRTHFSRFGSIGKVLVPPSNTIAVIEFLERNEAKNAFKNLAYSRFKSAPLYLEWAPANLIKPTQQSNEIVIDQNPMLKMADKELSVDAVDTSTVYVKNLNFRTTEEKLKSVFESVGGINHVTIAKKKKGTVSMSMGFGFIEFSSKEFALKAIQTLQGVIIDDHTLELKLSQRKSIQKSEKITEQHDQNHRTKILMKNIPFEANVKELRQFLKSFGQLKSVRMPKKFDGTHRGFGFVEYATAQEAKRAFDELYHTHFYGRHLVLEWTDDNNSVEALRLKTKSNFKEESASKKVKLDSDQEDDD
jgi:multiple RNA-binding domain-containing protein 1